MEKIEVVNSLRKTALELRIHLLNMCCQVDGALHIGGDLSVADILTALFFLMKSQQVLTQCIKKPSSTQKCLFCTYFCLIKKIYRKNVHCIKLDNFVLF